jgi:tetratricopeptide (TPR) repeat protein
MQKRVGVLMLMVIAVNLVMGFTKYSFEKHAGAALSFNNAARYQDTINEVEAGKSSLVTLNPFGLPLEFYSSEAYRMLKQYDKALEESNKATAYHPYSAKVMITLGNVYTNMGQFAKAIPVYEKARSITPEDQAILKNLAINYYQVGKYKETVSILDQLKIGSGHPQFGQMYYAAKTAITAAEQKPR